MKRKYAEALIDMAERFGQTSTAERLKVGALIYKNDSIISLGVNGMPPKWLTEDCEYKEYAEDKLFYLFDGSQDVSLETKSWLTDTYPNIDEKGQYSLVTKPECRHAEIAALEKLWNSSETAQGATMFISHSPCKFCGIKILTAGIQKVYYRHNYRSAEGIEYLVSQGVEVEKI